MYLVPYGTKIKNVTIISGSLIDRLRTILTSKDLDNLVVEDGRQSDIPDVLSRLGIRYISVLGTPSNLDWDKVVILKERPNISWDAFRANLASGDDDVSSK